MNRHKLPGTLPQLMGIVNMTEDSFSDGNRYLDPSAATRHALELLDSGAEIIDLGAESTRPGASPVPAEIQMQRLIPVITQIINQRPETVISVDTRSAEVALNAIQAGAKIINDISALRYDPDLALILADNPHVRVILMHMQGEPQTMQQNPQYHDLIPEIKAFFEERIIFCQSRGVKSSNIMLDPGIGFGKTLQHNLELLAGLDEFHTLGLPLVLGTSRKSFINLLSPSSPENRLAGTLATAAWGVMKGAAVLRVHDVAEHDQFLKVFCAIAQSEEGV